MPVKGYQGPTAKRVWACLNAYPHGRSVPQIAEETGLPEKRVRPALVSLQRGGHVDSRPTGLHSGGKGGGADPKFIWKTKGALSCEASASRDLAEALGLTAAKLIPKVSNPGSRIHMSIMAGGNDD